MAHFDEISDDLLVDVSREIGVFINRGQEESSYVQPSADTPPPLELAESVAVWKLSDEAFEVFAKSNLEGDISRWTEKTPFVHHQIRLRGQPEGFVRSDLSVGRDRKAVVQISVSDVAKRLAELFSMIDNYEQEDAVIAADPVVRLLDIPGLQILALWLFAPEIGQSRVAIVHAPKRYEELAGPGLLDSNTFFRSLKRGGYMPGVI